MRLTHCSPLLAAAALAACATQPAQVGERHLGYGTPGVSAYLDPEQATDLRAIEARCAAVPQTASTASQIEGLPAACAQLRRTGRNQPGNSVQPNPLK